MAPHTRNQANNAETENTSRNEDEAMRNANMNQNPEALTALAAQLVDLLAMGTNANRGMRTNKEEQHGCTFEQFNKQHPPVFEGQPDAIAAENWVSQMEKLMEVMCCTDDQMVRYATFKLTAEAERWWIAKKEHLQQLLGDGVPITWKDFKNAFLERFFPQSVRQAKAQEFTDLVQGSLTVEQYAAKFIELSRFAPYLVSTEDLKARKFERGLQSRIMNQVVGFEISNLSDLISKASVIERTFKINAESFNQKKRTAPQGSQFGGHFHNPNKRRFNPPTRRNTAP
jgi:hypothetical protein